MRPENKSVINVWHYAIRAAVFLLARVGEKDFEVLLGVEFRLFRSKLVTVVGTRESDIGSQEESEDMAICRRLAREVYGLLSVSQLQNGFKRASRSVQIPRAKFLLHIVHLDTKQARYFPEAYERSTVVVARGILGSPIIWCGYRGERLWIRSWHPA
jgi:hypothetical protein